MEGLPVFTWLDMRPDGTRSEEGNLPPRKAIGAFERLKGPESVAGLDMALPWFVKTDRNRKNLHHVKQTARNDYSFIAGESVCLACCYLAGPIARK